VLELVSVCVSTCCCAGSSFPRASCKGKIHTCRCVPAVLCFSTFCVCARVLFGSIVRFVHQSYHSSKLPAAAPLPAVCSNTESHTAPSFFWVCLQCIHAPAPFRGLGIRMAFSGQLCVWAMRVGISYLVGGQGALWGVAALTKMSS
jgi:hypothetical protein